jgi:hypothetical protein
MTELQEMGKREAEFTYKSLWNEKQAESKESMKNSKE